MTNAEVEGCTADSEEALCCMVKHSSCERLTHVQSLRQCSECKHETRQVSNLSPCRLKCHCSMSAIPPLACNLSPCRLKCHYLHVCNTTSCMQTALLTLSIHSAVSPAHHLHKCTTYICALLQKLLRGHALDCVMFTEGSIEPHYGMQVMCILRCCSCA